MREKAEEEREGTRPRDRKGNIKMDHDVIILELLYCNNIVGDCNNWWAFVYMEMNIQFPYCG